MASISFEQKPEESLKYLKQKKPELTFDYDEIMHEAHHKAFTVAKVTKLDLLSDLQNALIKARKEGLPFEAWQKEIKPTLKAKGWYGYTTVTNPKTKEEKEIYVGSRRLRNIFYTNTRVASNVGRWQHQDQLPDAPYLRYVAILDNRNRPSHAKNHGIIRHKDDPFWLTHYPPNDWSCRCRVQAYSMASIKRRGWEDELKAPTTNIAGKDWAYDVRTGSREQLEAYATKKYPNILEGKALKVRKTQLDEMVDELIVKKNLKYPLRFIEIGAVAHTISTAIKKMFDIDLEERGIVLEKNQLLHARPERKESYGQAFTVDEMKQIVGVLEESKDVYIDKEAIIYLFEDKKDDKKINKIVVHTNRKVKKFGVINGLVTLSKVKKTDFDKDVDAGLIEKVE